MLWSLNCYFHFFFLKKKSWSLIFALEENSWFHCFRHEINVNVKSFFCLWRTGAWSSSEGIPADVRVCVTSKYGDGYILNHVLCTELDSRNPRGGRDIGEHFWFMVKHYQKQEESLKEETKAKRNILGKRTKSKGKHQLESPLLLILILYASKQHMAKDVDDGEINS